MSDIKRENQNLQQSFCWHIANPSTAATLKIKIGTMQMAGRIDKVEYNSPAGLAGHADNHFTLDVLKDATSMTATYSTDSDVVGQGTLAADALQNIALHATAANQVFAAGEVLSCLMTKAGTQTLPAGTFIIHGRWI